MLWLCAHGLGKSGAAGTGDRKSVRIPFADLCIVCAWSAGLQLAVLAFEDKPMRSRMAHVAYPLDKCAFGFNELERMGAICRDSHCDKAWSGFGRWFGLGSGI